MSLYLCRRNTLHWFLVLSCNLTGDEKVKGKADHTWRMISNQTTTVTVKQLNMQTVLCTCSLYRM